MKKTYTEMSQLYSFKDRFEYLATKAPIGTTTFGAERYLNQNFYRGSKEWLKARDKAIIRDSHDGFVCDLGHPDHPIRGKVVVHHINPITIEDIENGSPCLTDLDNLVCASDLTHNAIHYGNYETLPKDYVPRTPNDTAPWKL